MCFVYMSNSLLKFFVKYPFDKVPARLISQFKYDTFDVFVNTGVLGSGYMHFGYAGVILYGFMVGGLFYLINSISNKRLPIWFTSSVMAPSLLMTLTSVDLTVGLLTNGILPGMMVIWLFSAEGQEQDNR